MEINKIIQGDCIEVLKTLPDNSVDAIVTDPPYGLSFMGKKWDYDVPSIEVWKECLRVLKHGGFLLSFAGTRTYHRMAINIEDAGFEIRDMISWLYGSGFPKSLNIGKQIDKMNGKYDNDFKKFGEYVKECRELKKLSRNQVEEKLGVNTAIAWWEGRNHYGEFKVQLPNKEHYNKLKQLIGMDNRFDFLVDWAEAEREVIGTKQTGFFEKNKIFEQNKEGYGLNNITLPNLPEAKQWEGWGTALKPAHEPIVVARKPLSEKNVALNVLKWGTGGINIDACRVGNRKDTRHGGGKSSEHIQQLNPDVKGYELPQGRFPANIILDEEAGKMLDEQSGISNSKRSLMKGGKQDTIAYGDYGKIETERGHNDSGGASRFFYCAKASKSERNYGCENLEGKPIDIQQPHNSKDLEERYAMKFKNNHPTVKPVSLMEYLVKLVSKPKAIILDPFIGSGTTAIACLKLNRFFIGIEKEPKYIKIANARIKPFLEQRKLI